MIVGGVKALVQLLEQCSSKDTTPSAGTEHAVRALAGLTADPRAALEAASENGVSLLVELLALGGQHKIALYAATALGELLLFTKMFILLHLPSENPGGVAFPYR